MKDASANNECPEVTLDAVIARRLAVEASCDPRTLVRVLRGKPVRGMAGHRARTVLVAAGLLSAEPITSVQSETTRKPIAPRASSKSSETPRPRGRPIGVAANRIDPKRHISGLAERVYGFRLDSNLSIQVAATRAGLSIPRWRDAESFGLSTTNTLELLEKVGVDVTGLKLATSSPITPQPMEVEPCPHTAPRNPYPDSRPG